LQRDLRGDGEAGADAADQAVKAISYQLSAISYWLLVEWEGCQPH
jgi:hypothetical protein